MDEEQGEVTQQNLKRLNFLWHAAHCYSEKIPQIAHILSNQMVDTAFLNDVAISLPIRSKLCSYCSNLLVPGENSRIQITPIKRLSAKKRSNQELNILHNDDDNRVVAQLQRKKRKLKNSVTLFCNVCKHSTHLPGSEHNFLQKVTARALNNNDTQSKTNLEQGKQNLTEKVKEQNSNEKKKKKNKLNALSQVLKEESKKVVSILKAFLTLKNEKKKSLDLKGFLESFST